MFITIPVPWSSMRTIMMLFNRLAPVVRMVDNSIHRKNRYPLDGVVCFTNTYLLDSAIQLYNKFKNTLRAKVFRDYVFNQQFEYNRPFLSPKTLTLKTRPSAKPFLRKMSFICTIIKNRFRKKGFAFGLVLKQRFAASRKWSIQSIKIMQLEAKNNIVFSELQFLVHIKGWKTSLQVELRKLNLEQDKYTRCKRKPSAKHGVGERKRSGATYK